MSEWWYTYLRDGAVRATEGRVHRRPLTNDVGARWIREDFLGKLWLVGSIDLPKGGSSTMWDGCG
jgi:hypothetical protein